MEQMIFFLDFDGVVCDSLPECFLSAHRAYHEYLKGGEILSISLKENELFKKYRPFIRNGEDYLLLFGLIHRGVQLREQEDLDREIAALDRSEMDRYGDLFYRSREKFLEQDRELWLDLNPLFPGMAELLRSVSGHQYFYILSTKKSDFIMEILDHHQIPWRRDRVLYPGPRTKKEIIQDVLPADGSGGAIFVDDQLDHLLVAAEDRRIKTHLASWGYVKPQWLERGEVPILDPSGLKKLVEEFRSPLPPDSLPPEGATGTL